MPETGLKTAAAYIRVSSDKQTELSPDSQIKVIRDYARSHGYILPNRLIFRDDGISGSVADKRPEFIRLIALSKEDPTPFETILLWKFSRFARNQEESIYYKAQLRRRGIDVVSVSEPIEDGPFGKLIERIIEWEDEYYLIRLSGEVKRGMTEKVERGQPVSIAPFGYKIIDKKFIIDEEKARLVRKIFSDFINGKALTNIAREFNAMGIKTNRGNVWENRTIEYILRNPVYIGKIRWNPKRRTRRNYSDKDIMIRDGNHEPIIDEETFDKVQALILLNKKKYAPYSRHAPDGTHSDYMLHGLLRCGNCGSGLCEAIKGTSVQCIKYTHAKGCNISHSITLKKLNTLVISALEVAFETGSFNLEIKEPEKEAEIFDVTILIEKEKRKLERVREAFEDGVYTLDEYKERRNMISEQITKLETYKPEKPNLDDKRRELIERNKELIPMLKSSTVPEHDKNEALRAIISKIVFSRPAGTVDLFFYI